MRSKNDKFVVCPFDKAHTMPAPRLQWHLAKCKSKLARDQQGFPTFHCRFNYMHIYFDKDECQKHESECSIQLNEERESRQKYQNILNIGISGDANEAN
jgi:hypothetical protein